LEKALGVTVTTFIAPSLFRINDAFASNGNTPQASTITLDLTQNAYKALQTVGGSVYATFPGESLGLVVTCKATADYSAVSARCTHESCKVNVYSKTTQKITCNCHGSQYTVDGKVLQGPASVALKKYYTLFDGATTLQISSAPFAGVDESPLALALHQNYPNPFTEKTTIGFTIPETGNVTLVISDELGREVATLYNGILNAGEHEIEFNAGALTAGIYFYRLTTASATLVKGMQVAK
jgi:Rieske Fe-S protein